MLTDIEVLTDWSDVESNPDPETSPTTSCGSDEINTVLNKNIEMNMLRQGFGAVYRRDSLN